MNAYCLPRRRGFTLVELLTVVSILALLIAILMPSLNAIRILARRIRCASNVREIVRASVAYGSDGKLHRGTVLSALPSNGPATGNWGSLADTDGDGLNDGNVGCLGLLVKKKFLSGKALLCPEAKTVMGYKEPGSSETLFSAETISYSYISMVSYADQTILGSRSVVQLIIVADRNPYCTPGTQVSRADPDPEAPNDENSANHRGAGQNVGRIDGSVAWSETNTLTTGYGAADNIFTAETGGSNANGQRADENDVFLLP